MCAYRIDNMKGRQRMGIGKGDDIHLAQMLII
jgi:hypothetical protein